MSVLLGPERIERDARRVHALPGRIGGINRQLAAHASGVDQTVGRGKQVVDLNVLAAE